MLIKLESSNVFEEISPLTKTLVGEGQGGKVYQYDNDRCIKILKSSNNLTEINLDYFIQTVNSPLLLSPKEKGYDENKNLKAYITRYIAEVPNTLSSMTTEQFEHSIHELYEEINKCLSKNKIAIFDGNDTIIGTDGKIYLCDFDMYKTPFSPSYLLYAVKGNYESYNTKQFDETVYSLLEKELLFGETPDTKRTTKAKLQSEIQYYPSSSEYIKRKIKCHATMDSYFRQIKMP